MTQTSAPRDFEFLDRARLEERACKSLTTRDFSSGLAPLCRLLLTLEPKDPERGVVLACLAVVYSRTGRSADAERALHNAEECGQGRAGDGCGASCASGAGVVGRLWVMLSVPGALPGRPGTASSPAGADVMGYYSLNAGGLRARWFRGAGSAS
jgi:hypothetical protein